MVKKIWFGVAGGLMAGTVVGLCEALFVLTASSTGEYRALVYAAVLYAVIGGGMGVGLGIGLALLGRLWKGLSDAMAWSLGFLGVMLPLGLVISRYIVNKAVYQEQGVPLLGMLAILGAFGLIAGLVLWLGPIFLTRTPLQIMLQPKGTFAAWASMAGLAGLFSAAPSSGPGDGVVAPDKSATPPEGPNVVLIVVDTLRADHLGVLGGPEGISPNIDAFAKDGVTFANAITQASWTRASFATLYTSRLPSSHSCITKVSALPDDVLTVAEVMSERGYATGGLPNNINVTRSFNFQQGFDYFSYQSPSYFLWGSESVAQLSMYNLLNKKLRYMVGGKSYTVHEYYQPSEVVLANAKEYIEANTEKGNRFFLVVHLMEPHDPYFAHPYNGEAVGRAWYPNPKPEEADRLRGLYQGEIRWMDQQLGDFFGWMKTEGLYDKSLVVMTADHGEEFYEHKGWWHGVTLYDEQIHVPLIVKLPEQELSGLVVPYQVRQMDVSPTVAALAGASLPAEWQGKDLFDADSRKALSILRGDIIIEAPPVDPAAPPADPAAPPAPAVDLAKLERPAVSEQNFEGNIVSAYRQGGWKYIRANEGNPRGLPTEELFNLAGDPTEQKNLVGEEVARHGEMTAGLQSAVTEAAAGAVGPQGEGMSCEDCQRLMSLGYMSDCAAFCAGQ